MVSWRVSTEQIKYPDAVEYMEKAVAGLQTGEGREEVWFLEHPPLYTSGTSANPSDLIESGRFPVYESGRGGQYTYHGPGQRVAYLMLDLKKRQRDVKKYVCALEQWLIDSLKHFDIDGFRSPGRIGIWANTDEGEKKIAAVGIRISRWVTFHGIAFNVDPNLEHFSGIVPCGIKNFGVTSLRDLEVSASLEDVDHILKEEFNKNSFLSG